MLAAVAGLVPAAGLATATTEPPSDTDGDRRRRTGTSAAAEPVDLDTNGDGVVVIGVATPGPRDDGGYYQAMVDGITQLSEENGFEEPIIVDNIDPAQAETELRNLARQNVDVIAVGAGELSDPLPALDRGVPGHLLVLQLRRRARRRPGIAQARDDSSQISYSAGYATGLLLQDTDATSAAFLGCCDLDFEREAFLAFEAGLQAVDDSFTATYIPTGDFNDVAGATEAYNQAVADGVGAVYPFLGGSQEASSGWPTRTASSRCPPGPADACEREELDYQIAVQFDAGVYVDATAFEVIAGELSEGERKLLPRR